MQQTRPKAARSGSSSRLSAQVSSGSGTKEAKKSSSTPATPTAAARKPAGKSGINGQLVKPKTADAVLAVSDDDRSPELSFAQEQDTVEDEDVDDSQSITTTSTERTMSAASSTPARPPKKDAAALNAALSTAQFIKQNANRKAALSTSQAKRSKTPPAKKGSVLHFIKPSPEQERRKTHRAIAEHLNDLPDVPNVLQFCFWAKFNFKALCELFRRPDASGKYIGCRSVPVEEFVEYISSSGFKGDCLSIVREIYKCAPPRVVAMMNASSVGGSTYELTMPMLHKFMRVNEHLTVGLEWSPINEFKKSLLDNRGALLRAWRLDIDLHTTGTVPYMTFIQACHKLQFGHHSQIIWNSFRPDATTSPLEFAEFAPEEAANLEAFIQTLWVSCQFDMFKAWEAIDVTERLWVPESEFVAGARRLGFQGDASMLYRGLDAYGHGRLWRRELEYLKTLFGASSRTPHGTPQIKVLRAWAESHFDGLDGFLDRLGLAPGSRSSLSAEQLAAGLEQLDYPGDCGETAHLVARAAGIADGITRELLLPLITGERPAAPPYMQRTIKSLKEESRSSTPRRVRARTPNPDEREKGWNNSVTDLCLLNEDKPACHRTYFSVPTSLRSGEVPERQPRSKTPVKALLKPEPGAQHRVSFKVTPHKDDVDRKEKKAKKEKKDKKSKKGKKERSDTGEDIPSKLEDKYDSDPEDPVQDAGAEEVVQKCTAGPEDVVQDADPEEATQKYDSDPEDPVQDAGAEEVVQKCTAGPEDAVQDADPEEATQESGSETEDPEEAASEDDPEDAGDLEEDDTETF